MNPYINAQILNMKAAVRNCEQACQQAALQDDGKLSKEEMRTLKQIHTASEKFLKNLDKIK